MNTLSRVVCQTVLALLVCASAFASDEILPYMTVISTVGADGLPVVPSDAPNWNTSGFANNDIIMKVIQGKYMTANIGSAHAIAGAGGAVFTAYGLPKGLILECERFIISGMTNVPVGRYPIEITATNSYGTASSNDRYKKYYGTLQQLGTYIDVLPSDTPCISFDRTPILYVGETLQVFNTTGGLLNKSAMTNYTVDDNNILTATKVGSCFVYAPVYGQYYNKQYVFILPGTRDGTTEDITVDEPVTEDIEITEGIEDNTDTDDVVDDGVLENEDNPVMAFSATKEVISDDQEVIVDLEVTVPGNNLSIVDVLTGKGSRYDLYVILCIGDTTLFVPDLGENAAPYEKKIKSGKHRVFDMKMNKILRTALKGVQVKWYAGCVSRDMEVCGGIASAVTEFK